MHLTCPNCGGSSAVADEQCVNCQWAFVGRVELEALLAVKAQFEHLDALEAAGAPLYEALASGAEYQPDYRPDYRADYRGLYRGEYRTGGRNGRGGPSSRPYLRVVPPLPPDPPPAPLPRGSDHVGLPRQHPGPESWFEPPAPRLEPVRPLPRGRHRREWFPLEAFD